MTALIPHLEFTIRESLDRLGWWQDIVDEELRQRLLLGMGHPDFFATTHYGVVAETDPASALSGGTEPLAVSASAPSSSFTVDINAGMAVTKTGVWMRLHDPVRQISLVNPSPGVVNVIYLSYDLQVAPLQQNDWDEWVSPLAARYGDTPQLSGIMGLLTSESAYVKVDTVSTYSSYSASTSVNFVPLALVTMQTVVDPLTGVASTAMAIDHTKDNYGWNRPWFSMTDSSHRAMLGTGVQSENNAHALSQNEITAGKFTPFQLMLNHGMIIAKDRSFAKIPGYKCESAFPVDQLSTDDAVGTATGFPNAQYFKLPYYPVRLGKCWCTPSNSEVGAVLVSGTNRIAFPGEVPPAGETLHLYYTKVDLCEPPVEDTVTFSTNNPAEGELLIAGGLAFETLASTQETLSDSYQFPMNYQVFVDGLATIHRTPQVVYCLKRLDIVGVQDVFTITQYAPGKLMMGLANAAAVPTMVVKVRVYGTDTSGAAINQLYAFTGATWTPFTVPSLTVPAGALQVSTGVFASYTNFVVEERTNDGPNSAIMIWCIQTPDDSYDKMKDAALIADVMWDGMRMASIRDRRVIETTQMVNLGSDVGLELFEFATNQFAGGRQSLYREDFRRPTLHILDRPTNWSSSAYKDLPPWNLIKLQVGLYGTYRTRALPVMSGSGLLWRVTFLPLRQESGTNEFMAAAPRFRFKLPSTGWTTWYTMNSVTGMKSTYELDTGLPQHPAVPVVPIAVQLEMDPFPYGSFVLYG